MPSYPSKASFIIKTQAATLKENGAFIKIFARIASAERTLRKVLFEIVSIEQKDNFLINHYISTYRKYHAEQFGLEEIPPDFEFLHNRVDSFSLVEKKAYKYIIDVVLRRESTFRDGFINLIYDEKVGFFDITFSSPSEHFSIAFISTHIKIAQQLFYESAIYPNKDAYVEREQQVATLREKYKKSFYELGRVKDLYSRYKYKVTSDIEKEERDITERESNRLHNYVNRINRLDVATQINKSDYLAGLENLQSVEIDNITAAPLITLTELTDSPIEPQVPSWKKAVAIGSILGGFLICLLLIVVKIFRDILLELKKEQEAKQQDQLRQEEAMLS
ncbi:MAG: hypothetical protein AAF573_05685 [Bacteroidota bacterium]